MTTNLEQLVEKGLQYEKIEKEKASERKALTRKNGLKSDEAKHIQNQKGQTYVKNTISSLLLKN